MSIEIIAFVFGCVLVLIRIIGGGLEIKEIKIPTIRGATRIVAIIDGCRPHGSTVDLTPFFFHFFLPSFYDSVDLLRLKKNTKKLTSAEAKISTISGKRMANNTCFVTIF